MQHARVRRGVAVRGELVDLEEHAPRPQVHVHVQGAAARVVADRGLHLLALLLQLLLRLLPILVVREGPVVLVQELPRLDALRVLQQHHVRLPGFHNLLRRERALPQTEPLPADDRSLRGRAAEAVLGGMLILERDARRHDVDLTLPDAGPDLGEELLVDGNPLGLFLGVRLRVRRAHVRAPVLRDDAVVRADALAHLLDVVVVGPQELAHVHLLARKLGVRRLDDALELELLVLVLPHRRLVLLARVVLAALLGGRGEAPLLLEVPLILLLAEHHVDDRPLLLLERQRFVAVEPMHAAHLRRRRDERLALRVRQHQRHLARLVHRRVQEQRDVVRLLLRLHHREDQGEVMLRLLEHVLELPVLALHLAVLGAHLADRRDGGVALPLALRVHAAVVRELLLVALDLEPDDVDLLWLEELLLLVLDELIVAVLDVNLAALDLVVRLGHHALRDEVDALGEADAHTQRLQVLLDPLVARHVLLELHHPVVQERLVDPVRVQRVHLHADVAVVRRLDHEREDARAHR
mmetsp:Transcript_39923/g.124861  ORF Transcript_39923/g.124861 Transcript_39923/m.124861 type:complete len:524 (+) Transcript_39923:1882-3453(+)